MKSLSTIPHLKTTTTTTKKILNKAFQFSDQVCTHTHRFHSKPTKAKLKKKKLKVQFCTLYMAQCNVTS